MAFHVATPLAKTPSRMAALLSFSPLFSSSNTGDATAACSSREHLCFSLSFASSAAAAVASSSSFSSSAVAAAPAISASARLLQGSGSGSSSAIAACRSSIASCGGGRGFFSSAFASPAPAAGTTRRAPMTTNASSATAPTDAKSVHDFTVKDINGEDVDLSTFKGKVLLIVNVASACGLTQGNYSELTQIYSELKQAGLEVLAFPCNQFGGQEPGTNEQIKEFACSRFKAEFPIFDKVDVNGPKTAPLYQFLKKSKGGGILGDNIKWNFGKFLVNQDGVVVERYAPTTSPKKIEGDIKKLLGV